MQLPKKRKLSHQWCLGSSGQAKTAAEADVIWSDDKSPGRQVCFTVFHYLARLTLVILPSILFTYHMIMISNNLDTLCTQSFLLLQRPKQGQLSSQVHTMIQTSAFTTG